MLTPPFSDDVVTLRPVYVAEAATRHSADVAKSPAADLLDAPHQRHGYSPSAGSRLFGTAGTIAVFSALAAGVLLTLSSFDPAKKAAPPLTVTILAVTPPEQPAPQKPEQPQQRLEQRAVPLPRQQPAPVPQPLLSVSSVQVPAVAAPQLAVDPTPPTVQAAPPAPPAAPPAKPQASKGPDTWEGRVLARLERFRRYPSDAQRARQQGTTYLRFRIDRNGHVLSSSVERTSGVAALDAAALETLRKADPLPKIPPDRPDEVELVVPVEFAIAR